MKKLDKNDVVLVFGRGQMAGFIPDYFDNVVVSSADVTKKEEIERDIKKYKPTVVINTAAKTSIDWCELNKLEAFNINTLGAYYVWEICKKHSVYLCHFSSGCIFSSENESQVYSEEDKPTPGCYYSWTKVWAENLLGENPKLLILRPRVVISSKVDTRNTISKWLTYTHFITDKNTVTIIEDMFPVVRKMIEKGLHGIYQIANPGTLSPYDVALVLKEKINPKLLVNKTTLNEVNSNLVAKRVTTILNLDKLKKAGFELPPADESVNRIIDKFKDNLKKAGGLGALDVVKEETKKKYSLKGVKATTFCADN